MKGCHISKHLEANYKNHKKNMNPQVNKTPWDSYRGIWHGGEGGTETRVKGHTLGHPSKGTVTSSPDAKTVHSYSHQAGDITQQRCIHQQIPQFRKRAKEISTAYGFH